MQEFAPFSPGTFRLVRSLRVWLVLLLLAAWALRLYHLDTMSLWWDESLSWDRATNSLSAILSNTIQIQTITTRDLHPPFYFVLLHFMVQAAGTGEFALRFLSAIANVLTLALFVPFTRVLFGRRGRAIGLLTVLFGTVSPFYVWYSQEARPYALALLLSVLCVYALLKWLYTAPQTWRNLFSRWFLLFGAAFALDLATLYLSFVLLPFFAATILLFASGARTATAPTQDGATRLTQSIGSALRARLENRALLFIAATCVVAFGVILFLMPRETDLTSWDQVGPRFVPLFIMLRDVWNSFAVGLTLTLDQAALLDWFLLACWLVGIFSLIRVRARDARLALFFLCYILLPALALNLGSYVRPLYLNSRHLITTSPAFYIGLAVGVDALAQRVSKINAPVFSRASFVLRPALLGLALLPIVGGALASLDNLYFNPTFAKDDHKAWAEFLRERVRPDDYLLLVAPQAEKIVEYYLPPGMQWESLPHLGRTQDWQEYLDREAILNAYRNHPRVWLLELHQPVADPTLHITDLLNRWGYATDSIIFRGISTEIRLQAFTYGRTPQEPAAQESQSNTVVFDHNLALVGYTTPPQIEAGARGVVNLYWRAERPMAQDINVSLRVVDAQGNVWGQMDAPPIGNLFPLAKWETERTYLDQHDFAVDAGAPPGKYKIELGVYETASNTRWQVFRGPRKTDAPIPLAEITVTRPDPPRNPQSLLLDGHADVAFGDAVRFVGYDLEDRASAPGSEIPLTLYFQVTQTRPTNLQGQVELRAPWWQVWNRARAAAPFTLDLTNRQADEIVQARVNVRVPGDASAGAYDLSVRLNDLAPQTLLPAQAYTFADVSIAALARSTELPSIAHPYNARFGDSIQFLGYDLEAPQPLKPNAQVKLILYWRALKATDTPYKVFTHLINTENKIYGQQDKFPLDGARPTTSWAAGEIFTDVYEFQVAPDAPPGAYKLEIGFYDAASLTRLPAFDANGAPLGDHLVFEDLRIQ